MRVVIATPFYRPQTGILATYAAGIEVALSKKGHEVQVVVFSGKLPVGLRHLVYAFRLWKACRGATFVLSLDMWSVGVPSYVVTLITGTPLMIRVGGDSLWERYVERTSSKLTLTEFRESLPRLSLGERLVHSTFQKMMHSSHHVFFNSSFQKNLWDTAYRIPAGKSSLLENFYPPREVVLPLRNRVFVAAGRTASVKNSRMLEKVFARVKVRHPEILLETNALPHDQHLKRLASSYATIIPSISEVNSNTAIESVVRGRPFITTRDTGTKERLGNYGLFIDTRSETALEDAIETLLDPVVYDQLASRARVFSFTRSWDEIAHEILAHVPEV